MVDNKHKQDKVLDKKIDELESLIDSTTSDENRQQLNNADNISGQIPILDELVTPDDYLDVADQEPHMQDLADRVQEKLTTELDEIVNVLKVTLKETIMTELKGQIKKEQGENPQSED